MRSSQAVRGAGWLAGLAAALWMTAGGTAGAATAAPAASRRPARPRRLASSPGSGPWTVYHGDPAGHGVSALQGTVATPAPVWASPALDGQTYGEPLVSAGRIYVATENDTVYALSPATGKVAWSRHLATPVPASSLPCGDIAPTVGITGTPVIDPARREIFVVADEEVRGRQAHVLAGLSTATGQVEMTRVVDPPGADTAALLQRTGLNLARGRVVFGFGGNDGDCATYRGRVVSVPEAGGTPAMFTVDGKPGQSQGAVWMGGGAPAVDGAGHVLVSAGNGSVYRASRGYDDSDSVLELSPSMRLLQYFAPASWASDNSRDLDLSAEPALLPGRQVLIAGKSAIGYLLNGAHLGGIGGQLASTRPVCSANIDGGTAVTGSTVYLPCVTGILAVRATASPPGLRLLWSSHAGGGPPIVAGGLVWTISQAGWLYGLDPRSGQVRRQAPLNGPSGTDANHFPTPSVGARLLLAPAGNRVYAFRAGVPGSGPAGAGPASTGPSVHASAHQNAASAAPPGGMSGGAVAGIVVASLVVLTGLGWLAWRRVPNRP